MRVTSWMGQDSDIDDAVALCLPGQLVPFQPDTLPELPKAQA